MAAKHKWDPVAQQWYVLICHRGQKETAYYGKNGETAAIEAAKAANKKIGDGKLVLTPAAKKVKLRNFAEEWMHSNERAVQITTSEQRDHLLETYIFPVFGDRLLHTITRDDVKTLLRDLRATMSDVSAKGIIGVLNTMLEAAVEAGYLQTNVAAKVRRNVRTKKNKQVKRSMTRPQLDLFLATAKAPAQPKVGPKYDETGILSLFFSTLARTGVRMGEGFGLQWSAFDFDRQRVCIRLNLAKVTGQNRIIWKEPKNGLIRYVDLADQLCDELLDYLEQHPDANLTDCYDLDPWTKFDWAKYRLAVKAGADRLSLLPPPPDPKSLVFPMQDRVFSEPLIRRTMRHALKVVKAGHFTPHELRHTYASLIISHNGAKLPYVSRQLGHATVQETFDTYGHLMPSDDRTTVNLLCDPGYIRKHRSSPAPVEAVAANGTLKFRRKNV